MSMLKINIDEVVTALKNGEPILIFDSEDRESEVDMVFYAGKIDVDKVYVLRTQAGGLICYATSYKVAKALGIPFQQEIILKWDNELAKLVKLPKYGEPPAFTLWINHINVKTGISDADKALTIAKLHGVVENVWRNNVEYAKKIFYNEFMTPGHVPLLVSRGLSKRRGHTELSIALTSLANLPPSVVFAEMLDKGSSLSLKKAIEYANKNGIPLVRGEDIINLYKRGLIDDL
mgnify:CR=1 FL=1